MSYFVHDETRGWLAGVQLPGESHVHNYLAVWSHTFDDAERFETADAALIAMKVWKTERLAIVATSPLLPGMIYRQVGDSPVLEGFKVSLL